MTREDREKAIEILRADSIASYSVEDILSARDMAIQALEQEPKFIAKSDGTIEQIKKCNDCVFRKEWEKIGKLLSVVLEKQTEQEPKEGHWIWNIDKTYCKCSKCGIGMGHTEYYYCPNCGAKMESEADNGNDD